MTDPKHPLTDAHLLARIRKLTKLDILGYVIDAPAE